jgi:dihydroorotate dehydrogenase (NAD+) catalytic subunit
MGGIGAADHVRQFRKAGADLFGIGSAVTGMDSAVMNEYFASIQSELAGGRSTVSVATSRDEIDMSYFSSKLISRAEYCPGLFKIELDKLPKKFQPGELAGKYFFLTVPGVGEKPFAIFSAAERSVVVRKVGVFTRFLEEAALGSTILLRGPYGAGMPPLTGRALVMIGGGTGTASLLEIARAYQGENEIHFLLGARNQAEFYDLDLFRQIGSVHLATDDGSTGHHGFVTGLLEEVLANQFRDRRNDLAFINCGPGPMVHACFGIQRELVPPERIIGSIEYMTSCGVGICGKCASPSGALTCIDGPFLTVDQFAPIHCDASAV